MESIKSWARNGEAVRQAIELGEIADLGSSQGAQLEVYTLHSPLEAIQQR
jgi:hypothetical protein